MPFGLKRASVGGKADVYPDEKKDAVQRAQDQPAENKPPPGYSAMDPLPEVAIEQLNAGFKNLKIAAFPQAFPDADLCLAHLKLLEAFHSLKEEVGYTDGAFDLWDTRAPGSEESVAGDETATKVRKEALSKIREKRWALYVARAVDRFESWWMNVLTPRESQPIRLRTVDMIKPSFEEFPYVGTPQMYTTAMLPPLGKYTIPIINMLS